ncbi:hypothetical protein [Hyphomonas sp.]|uniref:hypothetical protein n=1 Tax=Hyphomonas sp. TaxID=87 RepID=UPI0037BF4C03
MPRFGAHDGYDRVVIDWPSNVDYDVDADGREITVRFARMAEIDVAPVARRLGARISALRATTFPGGTALSFMLAPGVQLRHFRNGRSIVLDLARKPADNSVDPMSTRRLDQEKAGRPVPVPMPPAEPRPVPPAAMSLAPSPPAPAMVASPTGVAPPAASVAAPASSSEPRSAAAVTASVPPPAPPVPLYPATVPDVATTAQLIPPAPTSAPHVVMRPRTGAPAPLAAACAGDFEAALARFSAMPPTALAPDDIYNVAWLRRMVGDPANLAGTLPPIDAEIVGACSGRRFAGRLAELWRAFPGGRLPPEPILIVDVAPSVTSAAPYAAQRPTQPQPGGSRQ